MFSSATRRQQLILGSAFRLVGASTNRPFYTPSLSPVRSTAFPTAVLATATVVVNLGGQRRFNASNGKDTDRFGGAFNPYKILGVTPESPMADVKTAYRRLALKYHPDRPGTGNADQFRAVQEAYEALKDGKKWSPDSDFGGGGEGGGGMSDHQRGRASSHAAGAARRGYYAYEEPGSTTENYFENNTRMQTFARIVLIWCAFFIIVRLVLYQIFPLTGQATRAMQALGISKDDEPYLDASFNTSQSGGGSTPTNAASAAAGGSSEPAPKQLGFFARIEKAIADAAREDGSLAEHEARRQARIARHHGGSAEQQQQQQQQQAYTPPPPQQPTPGSLYESPPANASPMQQQQRYSGDFDPLGSRVSEQREAQNKQESPGGWMSYFSNNAKEFMNDGQAPSQGGSRPDGSSGSNGVYRF
jgi:curved DNA-binding protein CbpA